MKRENPVCEGSVLYKLFDGETHIGWSTPKPCKAKAAYVMEDGRLLCSVHARSLFTDYALMNGYAKRMYNNPKDNRGPQYVFDTPLTNQQ